MALVSLKGESVPETSWWSRERTIGAVICPEAILLLKAVAIS